MLAFFTGCVAVESGDSRAGDYFFNGRDNTLGAISLLIDERLFAFLAMRGRYLPVIAMIGLDIGIFMAGAVVVESVYGWPGIGQMAWQAIQMVDIPIIMGATLIAAVGIVLGNLLADLLIPFIDPRVHLR